MEIVAQKGNLIEADFQFADGTGAKRRWGLVLAEDGGNVWCAYCTSNPSDAGGRPVMRLGALQDGRVTNVCLALVCKFEKTELRRSQSVFLPAPGIGEAVLKTMRSIAGHGCYPQGMNQAVLEQYDTVLSRARAKTLKKSAKSH